MDEELKKLKKEFDSLESMAESVRGEFNSLRGSVKELERAQSTITSITSDLKSPLLSAIVRFSQGNQMQSKLLEVQQKRIAVMEAELPLSDKAISIAEEKIRIDAEKLDRLLGNDAESLAKKVNIEALQQSSETILKEKATVESRIQELQDELSVGKLSRKKKKEVNKELDTQQSILQQLNETHSDLIQQLSELSSTTGASALTEEEKATEIKKLIDSIAEETDGIQENIRNRDRLTQDLEEERGKLKQLKLQTLAKSLSDLNAIFRALVDSVRKTQQTFGITAGLAAQLNVSNIFRSVESFFDSAMSGFQEAAVTGAEIQAAQQAFFQEFGGVITSDAAKELAMQAKTLGITSAELAKARRVFMTQTLGDVSEARKQQDRIVAAFKEQGLTSKDAMQAIAQYSEIAARMGTRFQQSFAEAAADAKKIGVDLNKVNQVGDNIIGNFEGFLESMAELGAMGFGLDATRLAEIAESGDTGALFNELSSQLAATGKDIRDLRRSEQLALSEAFGIPFEELTRLATGEKGSGEQMVDQQKESNNLLTRLVELFGFVSGAISGAQLVMLGAIQAATAATAVATTRMALRSGISDLGKLAGLFAGGATAVGATGAGASIAVPLAIAAGIAALGYGAYKGYQALTGDDVISRPGYGNRTLVTPSGPIALNNQDNVVAYADDMISREAEGVTMLSKGALTSEAPPPVNNINVDLSKLEAKLDNVVRAIGSMKVTMNGQSVGNILVQNEQRAATSGIYKAQRVTD